MTMRRADDAEAVARFLELVRAGTPLSVAALAVGRSSAWSYGRAAGDAEFTAALVAARLAGSAARAANPPVGRGGGRKRPADDAEAVARLLELVRAGAAIETAARGASRSRPWVYKRRSQDAAFAAELAEAQEQGQARKAGRSGSTPT